MVRYAPVSRLVWVGKNRVLHACAWTPRIFNDFHLFSIFRPFILDVRIVKPLESFGFERTEPENFHYFNGADVTP